MTLAGGRVDVVVIGGGAAGLMAAAVAAARGRRTLVLERNQAPGRKVLVSGGGRCNFTNIDAGPENFLSDNPHFAKSALARFTPRDFLDLVEAHGIAWREKHLGQLFCVHSSKAILGLLLERCRVGGAEIRTGADVTGVRRDGDGFVVGAAAGDVACESVVVASGGLSWPKLGTSDVGYRIARDFGLPLVETRPGLAPLELDGADLDLCRDQSGYSFPARVCCAGAAFRDDLLLTHRGLSGPAALQASSFWRPGAAVTVDLLPDADAAALLDAAPGRTPAQVLGRALSRRFARAWCGRHGIAARPWAETPRAERERILAAVSGWTVRPVRTGGWELAEVTVGGVDTRGLSSRTLAARDVPGLHFVGEVVDVTGWLGGYNFQWAWASGAAAGASA